MDDYFDTTLVHCFQSNLLNSFPFYIAIAATRKALDLEAHWTEERPILHYSASEKKYDENFEKVLDFYPSIPDDYQMAVDNSKVEVSKKKKVTIRRL